MNEERLYNPFQLQDTHSTLSHYILQLQEEKERWEDDLHQQVFSINQAKEIKLTEIQRTYLMKVRNKLAGEDKSIGLYMTKIKYGWLDDILSSGIYTEKDRKKLNSLKKHYQGSMPS